VEEGRRQSFEKRRGACLVQAGAELKEKQLDHPGLFVFGRKWGMMMVEDEDRVAEKKRDITGVGVECAREGPEGRDVMI
jgi:hypothetical protein